MIGVILLKFGLQIISWGRDESQDNISFLATSWDRMKTGGNFFCVSLRLLAVPCVVNRERSQR